MCHTGSHSITCFAHTVDVCDVGRGTDRFPCVIAPDQISVPPPRPVLFWPVLDQLQQVRLHCGQEVDTQIICPHQVPAQCPHCTCLSVPPPQPAHKVLLHSERSERTANEVSAQRSERTTKRTTK